MEIGSCAGTLHLNVGHLFFSERGGGGGGDATYSTVQYDLARLHCCDPLRPAVLPPTATYGTAMQWSAVQSRIPVRGGINLLTQTTTGNGWREPQRRENNTRRNDDHLLNPRWSLNTIGEENISNVIVTFCRYKLALFNANRADGSTKCHTAVVVYISEAAGPNTDEFQRCPPHDDGRKHPVERCSTS